MECVGDVTVLFLRPSFFEEVSSLDQSAYLPKAFVLGLECSFCVVGSGLRV